MRPAGPNRLGKEFNWRPVASISIPPGLPKGAGNGRISNLPGYFAVGGGINTDVAEQPASCRRLSSVIPYSLRSGALLGHHSTAIIMPKWVVRFSGR